MMKRFLCLMLCLAMTVMCVGAHAEDEYSLTEKLQRQIEFGNGVKGAVVLNASGESEWIKALAQLNDTDIQIRAIKAQDSDQFQLYLYVLDGETQLALTRLYGDDQDLYLNSELLPALTLGYHTGGSMVESLMPKAENASWYSAALELLTIPETTWAQTWRPMLETYYADLELWLMDYAADPEVNQRADGDTLMTVRYEIPADAVKNQIKALVQKALNDAELMNQLGALVSAEQQWTYLMAGLMYYYEAAIDAMNLEGDVVLERDLSTMGETVATAIQLPLPASTGWRMLVVEQSETGTSVSLAGENTNIMLEMETMTATALSANFSGMLRVVPEEEGQETAVAFKLSKASSNTVDDDTREHDVTNWKLELSPAKDDQGKDFEPVTLTLMTHLHSKSAKRNATTLEVTASFAQGADQLSVAGSIKTASPWVLDQLDSAGAEDVSAMTESYLREIMGTMWTNLQAELSSIKPEEIPAPVTDADNAQTATGTDLTP